MTARVLMVQGTASSVGKSLLVAGLCRILRQDGVRVAPFKAQNMSLNAAVTADGLEIGRAQAVQAACAGIEPTVDMNPILLKPEADARSQVVVLGKVVRSEAAAQYYARRTELWRVVVDALDRLRTSYEVILIEGAGSPAEPNLRSADIVNMGVARHAAAPVLLVGDIDRGGVFASLVGTLELLEPDERDLVRGLIINKFRGDRGLLEPGLKFLSARTGKPVLGVVPYLHDVGVADEDSVGLEQRAPSRSGALDIAIIRLPHIANFDDFDLLAAEPAVHLRYVADALSVGAPDLVILPGSKTTMADLRFLRASGLAERVASLAAEGTPILGICGGYQMLGERLQDPAGLESEQHEMTGLGLLRVRTTFGSQKRTRRVRVRAFSGDSWTGELTGRVEGYEIHMGHTTSEARPLLRVSADGEEERPDGCVSESGLVSGTYVHGLFEHQPARHALISWLGARKGVRVGAGVVASREAAYSRLADALRAYLDLAAIYRLLDDLSLRPRTCL